MIELSVMSVFIVQNKYYDLYRIINLIFISNTHPLSTDQTDRDVT